MTGPWPASAPILTTTPALPSGRVLAPPWWRRSRSSAIHPRSTPKAAPRGVSSRRRGARSRHSSAPPRRTSSLHLRRHRGGVGAADARLAHGPRRRARGAPLRFGGRSPVRAVRRAFLAGRDRRHSRRRRRSRRSRRPEGAARRARPRIGHRTRRHACGQQRDRRRPAGVGHRRGGEGGRRHFGHRRGPGRRTNSAGYHRVLRRFLHPVVAQDRRPEGRRRDRCRIRPDDARAARPRRRPGARTPRRDGERGGNRRFRRRGPCSARGLAGVAAIAAMRDRFEATLLGHEANVRDLRPRRAAPCPTRHSSRCPA